MTHNDADDASTGAEECTADERPLGGEQPRGPTAHRRQYLGAVAAAGLGVTVGTAGPASAQTDSPTELAGTEWQQVWSDEFDDGIDEGTWSFAVGNGHEESIAGWGNEEAQYYTDGDNAWVEDGTLVLEAREEQVSDRYGQYEYTSTRMLTAGKKEFEQGRIDVRARLPEGQGIWPAIWMLGADIETVGWPDSGEIDVMELLGHQPETVHGTVHGSGYSGADSIGGGYTLDDGTFSEAAHTFSIVREADRIQWFVDGEQYFQVTRSDVQARDVAWAFDGPFYLLLNVAVGGEWPGYPDDTTEFPQQMRVEYVREFQPADGTGPCADAAGGSTDVDGQVVCDVNDDGDFRDVTGDGSVGQGDVAEFFGKQHRSAWKRPELFDFSGNGAVTHGDVVELFDYVALG